MKPEPEPLRKPRARQRVEQPALPGLAEASGPAPVLLNLRVTFDQVNEGAEFVWTAPGAAQAAGSAGCVAPVRIN